MLIKSGENMADTYNEYASGRRARLSPEGQRALKVFQNAHELGSVLSKARKLRGLTQRELETLSGIDQGDISRIERGELSPTTSTLMRLTTAMGARVVVEINEEATRAVDHRPPVVFRAVK